MRGQSDPSYSLVTAWFSYRRARGPGGAHPGGDHLGPRLWRRCPPTWRLFRAEVHRDPRLFRTSSHGGGSRRGWPSANRDDCRGWRRKPGSVAGTHAGRHTRRSAAFHLSRYPARHQSCSGQFSVCRRAAGGSLHLRSRQARLRRKHTGHAGYGRGRANGK